MKCLYYLAPTLESTGAINHDLHAIGVKDRYIHVISNNEAGLKEEHIHSSNYVETLDFVRTGILGAYIGFFIGMFGAFLLMATNVFGANTPVIAYLGVMLVATLFGAWVGGLYGVGSKNQKLNQFYEEIQRGNYLILIYCKKGLGKATKAMMRQKHPESEFAATDRHFINPFSDISRINRPAS